MNEDGSPSKTQIVRDGFERACKDFSFGVAGLDFLRTKKAFWTRGNSHTVDFIHFHRHGISYGAPSTYSVDIRVHFGIRALNDDFEAPALNGPHSDPDRLRSGRYHLRFNAMSWSMYDRCIEDLFRFATEQGEPWFLRFRSLEDLIVSRESPLSEKAKTLLADSARGNYHPENVARSLKLLGLKTHKPQLWKS